MEFIAGKTKLILTKGWVEKALEKLGLKPFKGKANCHVESQGKMQVLSTIRRLSKVSFMIVHAYSVLWGPDFEVRELKGGCGRCKLIGMKAEGKGDQTSIILIKSTR
jgi:hypothetical protein